MAGKLFKWVEPSEQLAAMQQNLNATAEALQNDTLYRQANIERVNRLLLEARSQIKQAKGIFEREPNLKGDSFIAFRACLLAATRGLQLARVDAAIVLGTMYWELQSGKGKVGANARWGGRDQLNQLYERYAHYRDGLGDLSRPSDIYDSFEGDCEEAGITPPEKKTFRNRISNTRHELGLK